MRILVALSILWAPILLHAMDVDSEFDKTVNFANYKTFRIMSGEVNAKSAALNNSQVKKNLEARIRARLASEHLTETRDQPDLAVRYELGSTKRIATKVIPEERLGHKRRAMRSQTVEGTLTIDILAGDRDLIWRAIVVEDDKDPAKVTKKLDEMVKKALDKYPPK